MTPDAFLLAAASSGASAGPSKALRLSVSGAYFVRPDGTIHIRKGITAFTLPKRAATGRKPDAEKFMDWAVAHGIREFRAFARVDWKGPPNSGVETGWEYDECACVWVLQAAAQRGCYVQLVANTGPFGNGVEDCARQLQRVDELCLAHENAILECWNEPQQNGGHDFLEAVLERYTPKTPGWSTGAYDPTPYTSVTEVGKTPEGRPIYAATPHARAGQSMDYHSPRKAEWSRCAKDAIEYLMGSGPYAQFSPAYLLACMLSEPPQVEQTIRDADAAVAAIAEGKHTDDWPDAPDDWRAYGAGCAFWGCGGTIHSNPDFQQCVIPTDSRVVASVDAFVAGLNDVAVQAYSGYSGALQPPPSDNPGSRRYRRQGADGRAYELGVRPYSFGAV